MFKVVEVNGQRVYNIPIVSPLSEEEKIGMEFQDLYNGLEKEFGDDFIMVFDSCKKSAEKDGKAFCMTFTNGESITVFPTSRTKVGVCFTKTNAFCICDQKMINEYELDEKTIKMIVEYVKAKAVFEADLVTVNN